MPSDFEAWEDDEKYPHIKLHQVKCAELDLKSAVGLASRLVWCLSLSSRGGFELMAPLYVLCSHLCIIFCLVALVLVAYAQVA